jgi:hypothetical protein
VEEIWDSNVTCRNHQLLAGVQPHIARAAENDGCETTCDVVVVQVPNRMSDRDRRSPEWGGSIGSHRSSVDALAALASSGPIRRSFQ